MVLIIVFLLVLAVVALLPQMWVKRVIQQHGLNEATCRERAPRLRATS